MCITYAGQAVDRLDQTLSDMRVWSNRNTIPPDKLAAILTNPVGVGTMDLVWGPDLGEINYMKTLREGLVELLGNVKE